MQHGSATGTITTDGHQLRVTIVGGAGYLNTDRAGLMWFGAPPPVQRHDAGRWLKVRMSDFTGFTLAEVASQLTSYYGPLEPKVRQATLNGRRVLVISWQEGAGHQLAGWLDAARRQHGPRISTPCGVQKGPNAGLMELSEYGIPLHITAPSNAIDLSKAGVLRPPWARRLPGVRGEGRGSAPVRATAR
jgi:hypothetical protein